MVMTSVIDPSAGTVWQRVDLPGLGVRLSVPSTMSPLTNPASPQHVAFGQLSADAADLELLDFSRLANQMGGNSPAGWSAELSRLAHANQWAGVVPSALQ